MAEYGFWIDLTADLNDGIDDLDPRGARKLLHLRDGLLGPSARPATGGVHRDHDGEIAYQSLGVPREEATHLALSVSDEPHGLGRELSQIGVRLLGGRDGARGAIRNEVGKVNGARPTRESFRLNHHHGIEAELGEVREVFACEALAPKLGPDQPEPAQPVGTGSCAPNVRQVEPGRFAHDDVLDVTTAVDENTHLPVKLLRQLDQVPGELSRNQLVALHLAAKSGFQAMDLAGLETGGGPVEFAHACDQSYNGEEMALRSRVVSRRYQIGRRIATGERFEVYEGQSEGLEGIGAVKRLKQVPGDDLEARHVREAAASASLDHPNVVALVDAGQSQGNFVLITEHLEGITLAEALESLVRTGRRFPLELALGITAEITRAVTHAHGRTLPDGTPLGIVHRNLCPEEVLLTREGAVKLIGFGHASFLDSDEHETRRSVPMTRYTAPEQASGQAVDARADLFSLGAILFELLSGEPLYVATEEEVLRVQVCSGAFVPVAERVPELELDLIQLIEEATRPTQDTRLGSARNLERRLDQFRAARGLSMEMDGLAAFVRAHVAEVVARRPDASGGSMEGKELVLPPEQVPDTSDLELPNRESVGPPDGYVSRPMRKPRMERLVRLPQPQLPRLPTLPRPRLRGAERNWSGWLLIGLFAIALLGLALALIRG